MMVRERSPSEDALKPSCYHTMLRGKENRRQSPLMILKNLLLPLYKGDDVRRNHTQDGEKGKKIKRLREDEEKVNAHWRDRRILRFL